MKIRKYIFELIINIAIVILSFIVVLLLTTIRVPDGYTPFSWDAMMLQLKQLTFWLTTCGIAILGIMTYSVCYHSKFLSRITSDEAKSLFDEYEKSVANKDKNYDTFKTFLDINNIETKKALYIERMEDKLSRYEYKLDKVPIEKLSKKFYNRRYTKYKSKVNYYIDKLDKEYINKNILRLRVRGYKPVKISYFKKNFLNTNLERNRYVSHADSKYRLSLGTQGVTKVFSAIIFAGITSIAGITFKFQPEFWLLLSGCGMTVLLSIVSGFRFASRIYESEIKSVIEDRIEYLNKFERWCAANDPAYYKKVLDEAVNAEINRRIAEKQKEIDNNKKENEK